MKSQPKTRVNKFTIGRLYNLGNYEHVRYELSVEVPKGKSAARAFANTLKVLRALNPKPPIPSYEYEGALERLKEPDAWHKSIIDPKERAGAIAVMVTESKKKVRLFERWAKRRHAVEAYFDDLGGISKHADAKADWDNDDY